MAVLLEKHDLTLMLVPKGASTSIKHVVYEVENGRPFEVFEANGRRWHIHNFYHPRVFSKLESQVDWNKDVFAVVRDPVERLLSCHSNRVGHYRSLNNVEITPKDIEAGVVPNPDFETFVQHLDRYCELSADVAHHCLPMIEFLGTDAGRYTRIFDSYDLTEFWSELKKRMGPLPDIPTEQNGGANKKAVSMTAATLEKIRARFAEDYRIYGRYLMDRPATYTVV